MYIYIERERESSQNLYRGVLAFFQTLNQHWDALNLFSICNLSWQRIIMVPCSVGVFAPTNLMTLWLCVQCQSSNAQIHTPWDSPPSPKPKSPFPQAQCSQVHASGQPTGTQPNFFPFPSGSLSGHLTIANTHNQELRCHVASGKTITVSTSVCPTMVFFQIGQWLCRTRNITTCLSPVAIVYGGILQPLVTVGLSHGPLHRIPTQLLLFGIHGAFWNFLPPRCRKALLQIVDFFQRPLNLFWYKSSIFAVLSLGLLLPLNHTHLLQVQKSHQAFQPS